MRGAAAGRRVAAASGPGRPPGCRGAERLAALPDPYGTGAGGRQPAGDDARGGGRSAAAADRAAPRRTRTEGPAQEDPDGPPHPAAAGPGRRGGRRGRTARSAGAGPGAAHPARLHHPPAAPPKQPKPLRQSRPARTARSGRPASGQSGPADREPYDQRTPDPSDPDTASRPSRAPRHLGRLLLTAILLLLVGAVVYALAFLPKSGPDSKAGERGGDRTGSSGAAPASPAPSGDQEGDHASAGTGAPQTTAPAEVAKGFGVRNDPEGFQVAVREGWQRRGANDRGQVRYVGGDYELVVVPGRDTTARFGTDPMAYLQNKEAELAPYRSSGWASASGLQRIDVGKTAMAEGTFSWRDGSGREVYVRNLAMIHKGRYHLVLVIGPDRGRHEIDQLYTQATSAYRPG
ncbi:hypothetical protein Srufu_044540 [Streptomyces libani subsp. rufus]|nr:hypothetical protein Srufu_044540 [Streptomyces libani subsp. rufus]